MTSRKQKAPYIILAGRSTGLQVLCSETFVTIHEIAGHSQGVSDCSIHGNHAVSAMRDGSAVVWDVLTGKEIMKLDGHADSLCCSRILSNGDKAVTGSMDCTMKIWDMTTGTICQELLGHADWIYSCAATPDDRMLVSASADKTLRVWDVSTGRSVRKLVGHAGSVLCCAIVDDGTVILSGSRDKSARVWDVLTGDTLFILSGHDDWVLCCTILGNSIAATGSSDGTIRLWGLTTGEVQRVFHGLGGWVNALLPIADDSQLLSISEDKRLRVWDVATGSMQKTVGLPCVQKTAAISKADKFHGKEVPKSLITTPAWGLRCASRFISSKSMDCAQTESRPCSPTYSPLGISVRSFRTYSLLNSPSRVTPPGTPPRLSTLGMSIRPGAARRLSQTSSSSSNSSSSKQSVERCRDLASTSKTSQLSLFSLVSKKLLGRGPRCSDSDSIAGRKTSLQAKYQHDRRSQSCHGL